MDQILTDAIKYRDEAEWKEVAHQFSADWHRRWGVRLGAVATILSALVGSAIFLTATTQLGLTGKGTLSIPQTPSGLALFYSVVGLSVLSPILSGLNTFLNEPEHVKQHMLSMSDYSGALKDLDSFIRKYGAVILNDKEREDAEKELKGISEGMNKNRILLTGHAIDKAKKHIKDN